MIAKSPEKDPPRLFYISRRDGHTIKRQYIGMLSDPVVALLARAHRLRQSLKAGRLEARNQERADCEEIESVLTQYCDQFRDCLRGWMRLRRWYFRRGVWRPRRRPRISNKRRQELMKAAHKYEQLVHRARQGDQDALNELRDRMDSDRLTWRPFGDLSEHVKRRFVDLLTANDVVARESLQRQLAELEESLRRDETSPVRELAIEEVLICWLDVHYQELMAADPREGITNTEFLDWRLERGRKRYRRALKTLAQLDEIMGIEPQATRS